MNCLCLEKEKYRHRPIFHAEQFYVNDPPEKLTLGMNRDLKCGQKHLFLSEWKICGKLASKTCSEFEGFSVSLFRVRFRNLQTMTMHIKFWQQHCNVYEDLKTLRDMAGFEPGIFWLEGFLFIVSKRFCLATNWFYYRSLVFNLTPRGELWPTGVKLVKTLFVNIFFKRVCSLLWVNEGVNVYL
jgi:hypothetical protein